MGISCERVGSIIHENLDMRKLSAKLVPKCLIKNVNGASRLSKFGILSARSKLFSVAIGNHGRNLVISLWPGDKATINGVAAWRLTLLQKFRVQKFAEKFLASFFGIKTASSSLIIFQRVKLSTRSITYFCWCNLRTFWRKNAAGISPRDSCSCTTMPRHTGHLQPRRKWLSWAPISWSHTLFSGSDPVGLPPVPSTEKTIGRSPFFVRRGGHCCLGDLVGRTTFWIFFWVAYKFIATG